MSNWQNFNDRFYRFTAPAMTLDISRVKFPDSFLSEMEAKIEKAFKDMEALEAGAIANPDENRMVGHYWLRNAGLAPDEALKNDIEKCLADIKTLATKVLSGEIQGAGGKFKNVLVIGIGGSALGPQFVDQALSEANAEGLQAYFFDNTDPNGIDRTLEEIGDELNQTISVVISKSGGTPETRNGMLEAKAAYEAKGLNFAQHAVAVTGESSKLDHFAESGGWITRLPMWDWVGGRTSELAAVGLLPAALQGFDIDAMLHGAAEMDALTRQWEVSKNPAALLALMWYFLTDGKGSKDMVVLPYKDRLELFSKYLQQLVMESLGKELDLNGKVVNQGIAVYGNKGSTDQHAYVQQLREGLLNFFVVFIEVLEERSGDSILVEDAFTSGDFLQGFYLGTRDALYEKDRQSVTITVDKVDAHNVGALIALFERAVGFYASLVNVNAYHQPGVEAGKKAAAGILELKQTIFDYLAGNPGYAHTAEQIAVGIEQAGKEEMIYKILISRAYNYPEQCKVNHGSSPSETTFSF